MKKILSFLIIIFISNLIYAQSKLPYPIIFVHGLNGSDKSWDKLKESLKANFDLSDGGTLNFCLNYDNNLSTSTFSDDYKDFTAINNELTKGDMYFINFEVDQFGNKYASSSTNQSNQQAIFKQGRAVRDAIKHILNVTSKNKVILVGHSMGGLASREYLENTDIWQEDGAHHVAKLFTNATPHGGSNATGFGVTGLIGLDESSEAVRDLRYSYTYSGKQGAFLFSGTESNSYLKDRLLYDFYSVDVNCNGITNETVTGLNNKPIPNDIYYTCLISKFSVDNGDGIVSVDRANMNNYLYYPIPTIFKADTFFINDFHTSTTENIVNNIRGLDEPDIYSLSYKIDTGITYLGMVSKPSAINQNGTSMDYDDYSFEMPNTNKLKISIENKNSVTGIILLDSDEKIVHSFTFKSENTDTIIDITENKSYYVEIASPSYNDTRIPYYFSLKPIYLNPTNTLDEFTFHDKLKIYPNPNNGSFFVDYDSDESSNYAIINMLGMKVSEGYLNNGRNSIYLNLNSGIYFISIDNKSYKLIIE